MCVEKLTVPDLERVAACIRDGDGGGLCVVTLHGVQVRSCRRTLRQVHGCAKVLVRWRLEETTQVCKHITMHPKEY